jgi:putative ABC transport system permease protein
MVKALDRKLLRDLWRLKSQVFTIALVVASGVGGFIGSLSAHASLVHLRDSYYEEGRFAHVFTGAKRAPQRIEDALRRIPGVVDAETGVRGNVLVSLSGTTGSMTGQVIALPEHGLPRMNRVVVKSGRFLEPDDFRGVLVSEAFAKAHGLSPGDSVTLLMNGKFEALTIRGIALSPEFIFAAATGGFSDDTRFGIFWATRERLQAAYDMEGAFNSAALRLARGANTAAVIAAVDRALEPYGSGGAFSREDQLSHRTLSREIDEQKVFGTVLPAVFLAVAVFLLNVMLSRHIATERSQIAALKALGYSNGAVGAHFVKLVLLIVLLGLLMGVGIGFAFGRWMTHLYTGLFHFPVFAYRLDAWLPLTAALLTSAAALLATASALRAVIRLPPAEAMRPPAPASFRPTLLDRLGLGRLYSPAIRMVVRELERRPARASLTVLGVASSVAILVSGTWWGDAFDSLIHLEFGIRQRPDIVLALAEPVAAPTLHEFSRLPGVLSAEGTRDVPVELRHLQFRLRATVIGTEGDARLRQVLDSHLHPLPIVPGAIALSARAAQVLRLRTGDRVWVDPLQGAEPAQLLPVSLLVGDLMGTTAYMERADAARLAGEDDTLSTIRLRVDARRLDAFYARVREIPRIAAVGEKALMLAHFRATTARNLLAFTGILSVFAAAIAVGVVYNSARITLAEHSWELATLRVLGFTRAEVSQILLGQLTVQMLLAIPIGFLLGHALSALMVVLMRTEEMEIPLVILPHTYAYAALVMLAAGVASALVVRGRIDRLDLVGVLKTRE